MPTDAFEDTLELPIELLEVVAPASPYPVLAPTGRREIRTFGTIILENAYLRVTVLPGLGGRILSIFDKRTGTEILGAPSLVAEKGGSRGVRIASGIQVRLTDDDRPNDLGPIDAQIEEPPEAVWFAESAGGTGMSFHLRVELPPERAEIRLEARVLNRTRRALPYNGGLALSLGPVEVRGDVLWSSERKAGLRLLSEELEAIRDDGAATVRSRFSSPGFLGPRQVDVWWATLRPVSGLDGVARVEADVAAFLSAEKVQVQAVEPMPGARLLLGLADGQTLEAPADLYPEHVVEIPLEGLPATPVALAVQDVGRNERLRFTVDDPAVSLAGALPADSFDVPDVNVLGERELRRLTFSTAHRALAYLELGHRALAAGNYEAADERLEQALLYNADDPLNWWAKAMNRRLAGADEEESPERLNAHFLAPLEPALRAEAFLSLPHAMGREPNALVAPLAERPEALIEVACLLLEIGVTFEASRWIDEALRHRDLAMLRYLNAWSLLSRTRMEAEAAVQVAAAGRLPFEPPYPWREVERRALGELRERFPQDGRLREYAALLAPEVVS